MKALFLFFALVVSAVLPAVAGSPNTMSYQGLLTTSGGTPVPDGSYKLQFDLFVSSSGGVSIWTEVDSGITVQRGTFSIILGATAALPDSFHQQLFLQVTAVSGPSIGSPVTFTPRSVLASAPSALGLKTPVSIIDSTFLPPVTIMNKMQYGSLMYGNSPNGFGVESRSPFLGIAGTNGGVFYYTLGGAGTSGYGPAGTGVFGITDSGTGVYGYAYQPSGFAGHFHGRIRVEGVTGDSAVEFPDNSISAHEILDEPGLASQGSLSFFTLPAPGTLAAVDSVTITIPATGYVVIDAGGNTAINHNNGQISEVDITVDSNASIRNYNGFQAGYLPSTLPTDYYFQGFHNHWVVAEAPGTYKFYLHASVISGTSPCSIAYSWITASFYTTSYGPVSETVPLAQGGNTMGPLIPTAQPMKGMESAMNLSSREVDLRELEIKADLLRQEIQRAEDELLKSRSEVKRTPE